MTWLDREARAAGLPLGAMLLGALLLHIGVAVLALNPWHPDEHFQILEFAWARAGRAPLDGLPWEFAARIRPTLQPALALVALRALAALGLDSPWIWVLSLRLTTLALAFLTFLAVIAKTTPSLSRSGRRVIWLGAFLLWFIPLFSWRFTSENLGGQALAAAIVVALGATGARRALGVGALLGLAFLFRFQTAFAAVALLGWLGWIKRVGWGHLTTVTAAGLTVVCLGTAVDRWFYGEWVFTPWRYLHTNLVQGVASSFGTSPWYGYLVDVPLGMVPPVGAGVAVMVAAGLWARPRSPWAWCLASFLVGHSVLAHKEVRFLFPLLYLLPPLMAAGWEAILVERTTTRWRAWVAWAVLVPNFVLAFALLTPAIHRGKEFDAHYLRFLARRAGAEPSKRLWVLADGGRPYAVWDLDVEVFRAPSVVSLPYEDGSPIPEAVPADTPPERLLVLDRSGKVPAVAGAEVRGPVYTAEPGYRVMARWMGIEEWPLVTWLEKVNRWSDSQWARRVYEVVR